MRGIDQRLALQRYDALVAIHVAARIDRHGDVALAEQDPLVTAPLGLDQRRVRLVEAGVAAQLAGRLVVGDEKVQRAVGLGLQNERPSVLSGDTEQGRQHQRFAERMTDRLGIACPREWFRHRAQPNDPTHHGRSTV